MYLDYSGGLLSDDLSLPVEFGAEHRVPGLPGHPNGHAEVLPGAPVATAVGIAAWGQVPRDGPEREHLVGHVSVRGLHDAQSAVERFDHRGGAPWIREELTHPALDVVEILAGMAEVAPVALQSALKVEEGLLAVGTAALYLAFELPAGQQEVEEARGGRLAARAEVDLDRVEEAVPGEVPVPVRA